MNFIESEEYAMAYAASVKLNRIVADHNTKNRGASNGQTIKDEFDQFLYGQDFSTTPDVFTNPPELPKDWFEEGGPFGPR